MPLLDWDDPSLLSICSRLACAGELCAPSKTHHSKPTGSMTQHVYTLYCEYCTWQTHEQWGCNCRRAHRHRQTTHILNPCKAQNQHVLGSQLPLFRLRRPRQAQAAKLLWGCTKPHTHALKLHKALSTDSKQPQSGQQVAWSTGGCTVHKKLKHTSGTAPSTPAARDSAPIASALRPTALSARCQYHRKARPASSQAHKTSQPLCYAPAAGTTLLAADPPQPDTGPPPSPQLAPVVVVSTSMGAEHAALPTPAGAAPAAAPAAPAATPAVAPARPAAELACCCCC